MPKGEKKKDGETSAHSTVQQEDPLSPVQEEQTDDEFLQKYTGENNQAIWFRNIIRAQSKHVMQEAITQEVCKATENIELQLKQALNMTEDLRQTLSDLKRSTEQKIAGLYEEIETLKQENKKKQRRIEILEFQHSQQLSTITSLNLKMDEFEQQSYAPELQVVGLQEPDENNNDPKKFIKLCRDKLGVKLKTSDIEQTTRLGRKTDGKTRHLLVKLKTQEVKDKIQNNRSKLVTNTNGSPKIYLNDRLTKHRQNLLFAARKLVKDKKLFAAWSQSGNILVRKTEKSKILQVLDHKDLMDIKLSVDHITKKPSEDSSTIISHLSDYDFSYDSDV